MGVPQGNTLLFLTLLVLGLCASQVKSRTLNEASSMLETHEQWMARYGHIYKDNIEKEKRFKIFKDNVEFIESFNNVATRTYKLAIIEFADLTSVEFRATRNGYKRFDSRPPVTPFRYENITAVPSIIDWRKKGVVTPVKDQGQCVEKTKVVRAVLWMTPLNKNKETPQAAKITGYEDVPTNSEKALLKAVANQPIFVAIDAGGSTFQFYSSGIFIGDCGTELDHGVTAVGYGISDDGTKYWLVKNSWGTQWGENGYIRMQRDVDAKGLCGIAMEASYPTA